MSIPPAFFRRIARGSKPLHRQFNRSRVRAFSSSVEQTAESTTPALAALRERLANGGPTLSDFLTQNLGEEPYSVDVGTKKNPLPKPKWMKAAVPGGDKYTAIKAKLRELNLHTVCEEAKCPNLGECWSGGETGTATATIMILGDTCTRGCRFCAVKTSRTPPPPDPNEPTNVAEAIVSWGLDYVVLTSVDRDDLPDQGSGHFAETVQKLKQLKPKMLVEALVPDFQGNSECVQKVATSGLDVFAHNIETVEELQRVVRDHRANFNQSLEVLKMAKIYAPPGVLTKTSVMLGCGETPAQVIETMKKVREAGVDVITFGQYMRPTKRHMAVSEYVTPEAFEKYQKLGMEMGFRYVASGPMVRSSYKAGEFYIKSMIEDDRGYYFFKMQPFIPSLSTRMYGSTMLNIGLEVFNLEGMSANVYKSTSKKVITKEEWEKKLNDVKIRKEDMNKLVMNFLVTEGYVEAAERFRIESGTEPEIDLATITDRMAVRRAVQSGNVQDAIEKVNDLNPEILDTNPQLFFHLQQQRLIELIRNGKVEEALEFAQEELAPRGEENHTFLEELERTVALLAFEDASSCPLGELLDISQRLKTASEVNAAILTSQSHEKDPKLPSLLKMLIWAQKQLDEKACYPHISDIAKATLEDTNV